MNQLALQLNLGYFIRYTDVVGYVFLTSDTTEPYIGSFFTIWEYVNREGSLLTFKGGIK